MARRFFLVTALLAVAACEDTMTTTVIYPAPLEDAPVAGAAPANPMPPPIDLSALDIDPMSGLPDPSVATCMSEVARASGEPLVAPLSVDDGLMGQTVTIAVGEARALWRCEVDRGGNVSVTPG